LQSINRVPNHDDETTVDLKLGPVSRALVTVYSIRIDPDPVLDDAVPGNAGMAVILGQSEGHENVRVNSVMLAGKFLDVFAVNAKRLRR
jgi:hypothetical protein